MWTTFGEALRVCLHHLRSTVRIAVLIGTILFAINQLDVVVAGRATPAVWIKAGLTYLVPFCVSNWGILVATRRRPR
ncbi:MAG: nitrate/nitrite transporter NrtS [Actinomycetota bacterium]